MTSFSELQKGFAWDDISARIKEVTPEDVERVLNSTGRLSPDDFMVLISPAAVQYLEPMAERSQELTRQRFGHTIQLYAPLYLSNECSNKCTYCGFSMELKIERKTLSDQEIMEEVKVIKSMGYDHVVLVTGESKKVGLDYFKHVLTLIRPYFSQITIEVQPLESHEYAELMEYGLSAVLVYQETYHRETYKIHHPAGKKSIFDWRINTPDRLGQAYMPKVGLGCLYGLEEWRVDSFFVALHLRYLEKHYWRTRYSLSFPRLRPHAGGIPVKSPMSERELVQLICAYRLFAPEVEISLSTRESPRFRDHVAKLGVTTMSAGSRTNPGGYAMGEEASLEQFQIHDDRTPLEVAEMLEEQGLNVVWKDWDSSLDV